MPSATSVGDDDSSLDPDDSSVDSLANCPYFDAPVGASPPISQHLGPSHGSTRLKVPTPSAPPRHSKRLKGERPEFKPYLLE